MNKGTIVVVGDVEVELSGLPALAHSLGWSVEAVSDMKQLKTVAADRRVVAVMLDAPALGLTWDHALHMLSTIAPHALPIVCHRFSEAIEWPELAEAGAFHALPIPLDPGEVRQSLGYVAAASRKRHSEGPRTMRQVA